MPLSMHCALINKRKVNNILWDIYRVEQSEVFCQQLSPSLLHSSKVEMVRQDITICLWCRDPDCVKPSSLHLMWQFWSWWHKDKTIIQYMPGDWAGLGWAGLGCDRHCCKYHNSSNLNNPGVVKSKNVRTSENTLIEVPRIPRSFSLSFPFQGFSLKSPPPTHPTPILFKCDHRPCLHWRVKSHVLPWYISYRWNRLFYFPNNNSVNLQKHTFQIVNCWDPKISLQ